MQGDFLRDVNVEQRLNFTENDGKGPSILPKWSGPSVGQYFAKRHRWRFDFPGTTGVPITSNISEKD